MLRSFPLFRRYPARNDRTLSPTNQSAIRPAQTATTQCAVLPELDLRDEPVVIRRGRRQPGQIGGDRDRGSAGARGRDGRGGRVELRQAVLERVGRLRAVGRDLAQDGGRRRRHVGRRAGGDGRLGGRLREPRQGERGGQRQDDPAGHSLRTACHQFIPSVDVQRRAPGRSSLPTLPLMPFGVEKLLLAAPRGYCAGVDRAVQTVERALELHGAPVYVRKEIVHNKHVVEQLRARGAIFVDEETEVPEGATAVFSAHGVAPSVHANAAARGLQTIDATCPLVTKVHVEAKKFAAEGYTIVLIGHDGHEEVEGTMGEAPDHIVLVETEEDVDALEVEDPERVAYISQTTLSVDETRAIILRLRERFPKIVGPAHRRHLLRHDQPPGGRQADGRRAATSCS